MENTIGRIMKASQFLVLVNTVKGFSGGVGYYFIQYRILKF